MTRAELIERAKLREHAAELLAQLVEMDTFDDGVEKFERELVRVAHAVVDRVAMAGQLGLASELRGLLRAWRG